MHGEHDLEHEEEAHLAEVAADGRRPTPRSRPSSAAGICRRSSSWRTRRSHRAAQLDLSAKGRRIRETLAHFGIGVKVARIQEGPVVTQYALEVEPGIKLSRIEGLSDNLALALSARSIRIEAPIPGEPYVGVEIPNAAFDLVTLKEVLGQPQLRRGHEAVEAGLRARAGRGRPAVQRRPGEDAAPAHRRRHRIGQERVRQRDHRLVPHERDAGRGEAHPHRPEAGRAGAVQGHPAPADRGHRRAGQGGQRPEVDGRDDGEPLRRVRSARRAQHRRLQRRRCGRASRGCRTSSSSSTSWPT